jgi:threonine/homoserine/homoserine lactone efflux protein
MLGTHDFLLFILAGLLLNITPGPDMLYVVGRSTAQGWRAGAAAALGIGAGCLVHTAAAALGLSAVLATSASAFTVMKILGALYLVYVGLSLVFSPRASQTSAVALVPASARTIFMQGFLTNVLNPKVAIFFLAFVPQFISSGAQHKALAFLFLGVVFNFNGTLWNLFVAWFTARATARLRDSRLLAWLNRCVGGFFVYLGVRLAFAKSG